MQLIFFTHPQFMQSQSMPRFASFLSDGMKQQGHQVDVWSPAPVFYKLPAPGFLKKWLGYIDQYIVFPIVAKMKMRKLPDDTLFVFTDQALGPWVPLVRNKPHVIHCHDFLAQRSALGEIPENRTGWTGKKYQAFIHRGYSKGKHFISVSEKTSQDLKRFLSEEPLTSVVVYNGLNESFRQQEAIVCREKLSNQFSIRLMKGFILHVGGNQWYKNRVGVIEIYNKWRSLRTENQLPLVLAGNKANIELQEEFNNSPYKKDIHILTGLTDEEIKMAYSGALVFLFPSKAEGFGWPIAEAMASGCPVITTNEPPMTEVAGNAAVFIKRKPIEKEEIFNWIVESSKTLENVLNLSATSRQKIIEAGLLNVKRFNVNKTIHIIEKEYMKIIITHTA